MASITDKYSHCLFTDGSFDPQSKIGVGGYCLTKMPLETFNPVPVNFRVFEETSCSRLEIQSALWALDDFRKLHSKPSSSDRMLLISDSRSFVDLPLRRQRLEKKNYLSSKTGKRLRHADLYQAYFAICDEIRVTLKWTKGHVPSHNETLLAQYFSHTDRAVRRELRRIIEHNSSV